MTDTSDAGRDSDPVLQPLGPPSASGAWAEPAQQTVVEQQSSLQQSSLQHQPVAPSPVQRPRLNPLAVLALVLGILGLGPAAIVAGHVGLAQCIRANERGRGLAIAGLILGYLATIAIVVALFGYTAYVGNLRDGGFLPA